MRSLALVALAGCSPHPAPAPAPIEHKEPRDGASIFATLAIDCEHHKPAACTALGLLYEKGDIVERDEARAYKLYRQGCDGGDVAGCFEIAQDLKFGNKPDRYRAVDLSRAACLEESPEHCHAIDLTIPYAQLEESCGNGDATACFAQAALLDLGKGVEHDASKAVPLFLAACEAGEAHGCSALGISIFRTDCEHTGGRDGCAEMGIMYATGEGVIADLDKSAALFKQACDAGNELGCRGLEISKRRRR
jgi:TPR repeat protein